MVQPARSCRCSTTSRPFALSALILVAALAAGCPGVEVPPPIGSDGGEADSSSADGTTTDGSNAPGCECLTGGASPGYPQNQCLEGVTSCGTLVEYSAGGGCSYEFGTTGEADPEDAMELEEANAMVVQCILDAEAAGQAFHFGHDVNPGDSHSCSYQYAATTDGMLQILSSSFADLAITDVASIKSSFELTSCQGMVGAQGWVCIEDAIDSATTEGTCWEAYVAESM